jgi:hypothetical protein
MLALLEASEPNSRRMLDLLRGAGREHARAWRQSLLARHRWGRTSPWLGLRVLLLYWGLGGLFVLGAIPVAGVFYQSGLTIDRSLSSALAAVFRVLLIARFLSIARFASNDPRRACRQAARPAELRAWLAVAVVLSITERLGMMTEPHPPGGHLLNHVLGDSLAFDMLSQAITLQFLPIISRRLIVWQQRRSALTMRRHRQDVPQFPLRLS